MIQFPVLPSHFGLCKPDEDLAVMIAFASRKNNIAAWDAEVQRVEAERKAKTKPKSKGR